MCSNLSNAQWIKIGTNKKNGEPVYIDKSSIKAIDGLVDARFAWSYPEPVYLKSLNKSYGSNITYVKIDCSNRLIGTYKIEFYLDKSMRQLLDQRTGPIEFETIRPNTGKDAMLRSACFDIPR